MMLTLPEPYYRDEAVTIYHARCEGILPCLDLSEVAMVLADPPYGIGIQRRAGAAIGGRGTSGPRRFHGFSETAYPGRIEGDAGPYFPPPPLLALLGSTPAVLWGANHYSSALPASPAWLIWDKRHKSEPNNFADVELAWTNLDMPARIFRHFWHGMIRDSEHAEHWHPTQKPIALMKWVLGLAKLEPGALVLDPYTGSGPVLRACKDLGYRAIGIDSLEWCCERAAERCRQEALPLTHTSDPFPAEAQLLEENLMRRPRVADESWAGSPRKHQSRGPGETGHLSHASDPFPAVAPGHAAPALADSPLPDAASVQGLQEGSETSLQKGAVELDPDRLGNATTEAAPLPLLEKISCA